MVALTVTSRIYYACLPAHLIKDAGQQEAKGEGDDGALGQTPVKTVHHFGSLVLISLGGRGENTVINITLHLYYQMLVPVTSPGKDEIALLTVEFC